MATLKQIDEKIQEAVTASEVGDFSAAVLRLTEASVLIVSVPDREFDGQKISFREKQDLIKTLIDTYSANAAVRNKNSGLKNIPIVRACR